MDENWDVVGHQWAVRLLQQEISSGNVAHAYLLTGPSGVGKMTLARRFAATLLCQDNRAWPCDQCRDCRLVDAGRHADLHIVEPQQIGGSSRQSLKIDQVRELRGHLARTPVEGRRRVAILRRFDEATSSAANTLLKTLEEPPPYVVIIVLADDASHLLPTIVSRCQPIHLRPLPVAQVENALVQEWHADPDQARLLAHLSAGMLGWAVNNLQDHSSLDRNSQRTDDLERLLGASLLDRFHYAEALAHDPVVTKETIDLWTGWWRDLMLLAANADTPIANLDRRDELHIRAHRIGVDRCAAMLWALRSASRRLKQNANARLTLEVLMLDLPRM